MDKLVDDDTKLVEIKLKRATAEYLRMLEAGRRLAAGTRRQHRGTIEIMLTVLGDDLPVWTLNSSHMTAVMRKAETGDTPTERITRLVTNTHALPRRGRSGVSLNTNVSVLRQFVKWCQGNRYLSPFRDPCQGFRLVKQGKRGEDDKWTVPFDQRDLLIETARDRHHRDAFVAAMGLFGGRRTSDIKHLKIKHIDLEKETFRFDNEKMQRYNITLPILWPKFMKEIRAWLAWYASRLEGPHMNRLMELGELDPEWYLIPRRLSTEENPVTGSKEFRMYPDWPIDPTTPAYNTGTDMAIALELIGAPMDQHPGMHTLRHSCGVWLRDHEKWTVDDIADWLDHSDVRTTKRTYLRGSNVVGRLRERYQTHEEQLPENVVPIGRKRLAQMANDTA